MSSYLDADKNHHRRVVIIDDEDSSNTSNKIVNWFWFWI
jgi:hypothetical protein